MLAQVRGAFKEDMVGMSRRIMKTLGWSQKDAQYTNKWTGVIE